MRGELDHDKVMKIAEGVRSYLPKVQTFLEGRGIGLEDIGRHGGWLPILEGMVPETYPTVDDLIKAVKAS